MADPYGAMATNPYLQMPQQEAPNPWMVLANMATGIGSGISQGAASGQGWAAGLAPGIMYGNQLTGMQQQNAQQQAMKRWQLGLQAQDWQSKQEERREKTAMAKAKEARDASLGSQIGALMGLSAPQSAPQMGPDFTTAAKPQVDYLTSKHGLSPVAAAGVVGNLYQESGFRPDAVGDNGTAYGMAQWRGDRQTGLVNFAKAQGKPPTDQNVQLDYLVSEMKGGDMGAQRAYGMLQQAKTPEEASTAMMHFFRPAGYTPANPTAGHGFQNRVQYAQALLPNGQPVAMGEGGPPGSPADVPPQNAIASLPAEVRTAIGLMAQRDPEKALQMTVQAIQNQKKEDAWVPLNPESARMYLGKAYEENKAYQRNRLTGKIEPVGGAQTVVNIDQKAEAEFGKEMGKMDAQRFGKIIEAEGTMNDMASKLGFALDQFKQTYTGPGAEAANQLNRILGAAGFEEAGKKANAADAAMAIVSQMKPHMRAAGSGASSDRDMDMYARALPSLLNLPDGNERIVGYFQRMADRATRIRELAQEHSEGGKVPLTRTGFDAEVKKLGPLFSEEERKELQELGKQKPAPAAASSALPKPTTRAEFDRLPRGSTFLAPDGSRRTKP